MSEKTWFARMLVSARLALRGSRNYRPAKVRPQLSSTSDATASFLANSSSLPSLVVVLIRTRRILLTID
jgi:hypothetical protein